MKVLPIIYGPAYDPNGGAVGICIYLGVRRLANQPQGSSYNFVQEVKTSPRNKDRCPVAGNPDFDIDNDCKESDKDFANSDLYRGKNHSEWERTSISTWIDPDDGLPFDYLFSDMPNRTLNPLPVDKAPKWTFTANLYPVRVDNQGIAECPPGEREPGMQNSKNPAYCRQMKITYGITATRQIGINGEVRLQLDPLVIDGKQVAPSRGYSLSPAGKLVPTDGGKPSLTTGLNGVTERVCRFSSVPKDSLGRRLPGDEPTKYRGPFTP